MFLLQPDNIKEVFVQATLDHMVETGVVTKEQVGEEEVYFPVGLDFETALATFRQEVQTRPLWQTLRIPRAKLV